MAAIDDVGTTKGINDVGRKAISAAFWIWFYNNQGLRIKIPIRVWFINTEVDIPLLQLRPLFVLLFGEDPAH